MWNIRSIKVGALGSTSKKLKNYIEELGDVINTALLQLTVLLGQLYVKEGFVLWVRFAETGVGEEKM